MPFLAGYYVTWNHRPKGNGERPDEVMGPYFSIEEARKGLVHVRLHPRIRGVQAKLVTEEEVGLRGA